MEKKEDFEVSSLDDKMNNFSLKIGKNNYFLSINLDKNNEEFTIKIIKELFPGVFSTTQSFESLYKKEESKIFRMYDSLEDITESFIKERISNKKIKLIDNDNKENLILEISSELNGKIINSVFILEKETYSDIESTVKSISLKIQDLSEQIKKLQLTQNPSNSNSNNNVGNSVVVNYLNSEEFYEGSTILKKSEYKYIKQFLGEKQDLSTMIYKSSRDGDSAKDFHDLVDKKGATISFIKNCNGERFGGYTSVSWDCSIKGYIKDENAFVFSLDRLKKFSIINPDFAIFNNPSYNVTFGEPFDIYIPNNFGGIFGTTSKNSFNLDHNRSLTKTTQFLTADVETFLIKSIE